MAKALYLGVAGKARKGQKLYFGVDGKARKVKKGYVGIGGKARLFYSGRVESGLYWSFKDGTNTVRKVDINTHAVLKTATLVSGDTIAQNTNYTFGCEGIYGIAVNCGQADTYNYNCALQLNNPESGANLGKIITYTACGYDSCGGNKDEILLRYMDRVGTKTTLYCSVHDPATGAFIRNLSIYSLGSSGHDTGIVLGGGAQGRVFIHDHWQGDDGTEYELGEYNTATSALIRRLTGLAASYTGTLDCLDGVICNRYGFAGGIWDNKVHIRTHHYDTLAALESWDMDTTSMTTAICTVK